MKYHRPSFVTRRTALKAGASMLRGTAENPVSRQHIIDKARGLIAPVLGAATSQKLIR